MKPLIVGTRGSELALTQTRWVVDRMREAMPNSGFEIKVINTTGDKDTTTRLDKFREFGVFVKELQSALLTRDIDIAVHSLKDVPEEGPEGLSLVAFPEREDARDVLISQGVSFNELPAGAVIGTGSPRRLIQLKALRGDLKYEPLRGNLGTRIKKVEDGELAAIILAAAGLKRLGLGGKITRSFSMHDMVPAIGQGALALECRSLDKDTIKICRTINNSITEICITIERNFMKRIGGGCKVPMAAHVYPSGDGVRFIAIMGDMGSGKVTRFEKSAELDSVDELIEDALWEITEACKDEGITLPRDLPDTP